MSYFNQSNVPSVVGNGFTVDGARLTINVTDHDSAEEFIPPEKIADKSESKVRWYKLEERTSKTSKHWRDLLAKELCHQFLLLESGGPQRVKYTLTDFPHGYHLYTSHVGTGAVHDDVRKDAYLCGGGYKFRSPQEALCHFAWLMSGKPLNRCRCIYDDKTWKRKQGPLNKVLAEEWNALRDYRVKEKFDTLQRGEVYEPPVGFNEASFLRPNDEA